MPLRYCLRDRKYVAVFRHLGRGKISGFHLLTQELLIDQNRSTRSGDRHPEDRPREWLVKALRSTKPRPVRCRIIWPFTVGDNAIDDLKAGAAAAGITKGRENNAPGEKTIL